MWLPSRYALLVMEKVENTIFRNLIDKKILKKKKR